MTNWEACMGIYPSIYKMGQKKSQKLWCERPVFVSESTIWTSQTRNRSANHSYATFKMSYCI